MKYLIIYLKSYCGRHGSFVSIIFELPSFLSRLSPGKLWPTWRIRGPGLAMCDHMSMRTECRKELSSFVISKIHNPGRLTWNLQITDLERKMIFQTSMIMFHVNLPGLQVKRFLQHGWWKGPSKACPLINQAKASEGHVLLSLHDTKKTKGPQNNTHRHTGTKSFKTVRN